MSDYALEAHALCRDFGAKRALNHLDLALERGAVHAVVGSNGAGKSTLFRILLGFLGPDSGRCTVLGEDSRRLTPETRGRIGLVNEEHTLPSWMRVRDLLRMQRSLYPRWDAGLYREVVGHFDVLPEQRIGQLSRGERAGLNLAMALAQSPELLILDEPTLGLDVVAKQAFLQCLLFVGEGVERTVVYCSHQMDEIERVADNLVILERGRVVSHSAPEDFCGRITYWVADQIAADFEPAAIPGLLKSRAVDGQHHLIVVDPDDDFDQRLRGMGAQGLSRLPLGLDRAVDAYLTRNHQAPAG